MGQIDRNEYEEAALQGLVEDGMTQEERDAEYARRLT